MWYEHGSPDLCGPMDGKAEIFIFLVRSIGSKKNGISTDKIFFHEAVTDDVFSGDQGIVTET